MISYLEMDSISLLGMTLPLTHIHDRLSKYCTTKGTLQNKILFLTHTHSLCCMASSYDPNSNNFFKLHYQGLLTTHLSAYFLTRFLDLHCNKASASLITCSLSLPTVLLSTQQLVTCRLVFWINSAP